MPVHESTFRVLYAHTDKAGVVYYANYLQIFESGRTEQFRSLGKSYAEFEEDGIFLTVVEAHLRYRAPAYYDDLLTVRTWISKVTRTRVFYEYEILSPRGDTLCTGATTLGCINSTTMRPCALPEGLMDLVGKAVCGPIE
jgi:acyl-CoA thioester hydrolase